MLSDNLMSAQAEKIEDLLKQNENINTDQKIKIGLHFCFLNYSKILN